MHHLLIALAGLCLLASCTSSSPPPAEGRNNPPGPPTYQSRERSTAPSPVFRLENEMTKEQAEAAGVTTPEDEKPKEEKDE